MTYLIRTDSSDFAHFGIKGMRWGVRRKKQFSGVSEPVGPRATSSKSAAGKPETRENALVSRAINQGYQRSVGPSMAMYVRDIPRHNKSADPKVQALLDRVLQQGLNRTEEQAGRRYMEGLPATYRP